MDSNSSLLKFFIFVFLLVILPLAFLLSQSLQEIRKYGAQQPVKLIISPNSGQFEAGSEFILKVIAQDLSSFDALDIALDLSNLQIRQVNPAPLPQGLEYLVPPFLDNNRIFLSLAAGPGSASFPANLELASITVQAGASCLPGQAGFNSQFTLVAGNGQSLPLEFTNANLTFAPPQGAKSLRLTSPLSLKAVVGQSFSYTALVENADNPKFTFMGLPDWLNVQDSRLTGTPNQTGTYALGLAVLDKTGASVCAELNLEVLPADRAAQVNYSLSFEGKPSGRWGYNVAFKVLETGLEKTLKSSGEGQGIAVFENLEPGKTYKFLAKGYQNLAVKKSCATSAASSFANAESNSPFSLQSACSLSFGVLPAGDIAPKAKPDNTVNSLDFSVLVSEWSAGADTSSVADFNDDRYVNSIDYSILLNNFGQTGDK